MELDYCCYVIPVLWCISNAGVEPGAYPCKDFIYLDLYAAYILEFISGKCDTYRLVTETDANIHTDID